MVETVTSRVSVLPVVGSDLLTGLSVAAGGTDQLFLDSGDVLDKVGHGAGRSGARMVPVERLLKLREVRDIMFSWMRPVAVLTSQFFLSEEGEDVDIPLLIDDDRALLQQEVDFNCDHDCPQGMEQVQNVEPTENRWVGNRILDILCWFCRWLNTQKLDPRNASGEMCGHYRWKFCTDTVIRSIQYPSGDSELSDSPVYEA